jgi:hypothetical protein
MKPAVRFLSALALIGGVGFAFIAPARAASHRDAPGQLSDPDANITDVYAFVTANQTVSFALNTHPFIDPDEGPLWTNFSPDVLYEIHIENDAQLADGNPVFTGKPQITYQFRFSPPAYQNTNTILTEGRGQGLDAGPIEHVGEAHQNLIQTYTVTRVNHLTGQSEVMGAKQVMIVPPPNVGLRATPYYNDANGMALPGAGSADALDRYTQEGTYDLGGGRKVFAGMREDGFYFDQGGTFDLLNLRNPGIDTFAGINVMTLALQVPISDLMANGGVPILGVYATTSRRQVSVRPDMGDSFSAGRWKTVSRMGNPVFNEALVALDKKDLYNQTLPDGDEQFRKYAENPELAVLINAVALGSKDAVDGPIKTTGRTDLSGIYIPDLLKLDVSTPAVPLAGQPGYNRLSVFGGDTMMSAFQKKAVPSGWPNGRRFGDDVIDIALTAVAQGTPVGDNVDSNDVTYPMVFPYLGVPHSALNHKHHGQPAAP